MTNRTSIAILSARIDILEQEKFAGRKLPDLEISNRDGTTTTMRRTRVMPGRGTSVPVENIFDGVK